MRHQKSGRKIGSNASHRRAILGTMAAQIIEHGRLHTTETKAKELRSIVDGMITLAKRGNLHSRRLAVARVRDEVMVKKLFDILGPRYKERSGGYTRVLRAGYRHGDSAPMAVIELVDRDPEARGQDSGPTQDRDEDVNAGEPAAA